MAQSQQLTAPEPETTTEEVVQTVVIDLETSNKKTEQLRRGIDAFQEIAGYFNDLMPSIPESERTRNNSAFYNLVQKEFEDTILKKSVARDAAHHAIAVWDSHTSRGGTGDRPTLGEGSYMQLCSQDFEIVDNDDAGYGVKLSFIPYNSEWFGISPTPYSRTYLERLFDEDDEAETGSCEIHIGDDGSVRAHVVVKWPVEVYERTDVSTVIGVDIGETVLYAAAAVDDGDVLDVEMQSGSEFRHYRERLKEKRQRLMAAGDLRGINQCRDEHRRYTEHVLHTASRRIVEFAVENGPAAIALEDLTHFREQVDDPIHDWPYADLQSKIAYKAKAEGIPVTMVDPSNTTIECRQCGHTTTENLSGAEFHCKECGYEVNRRVNAAINVAENLP